MIVSSWTLVSGTWVEDATNLIAKKSSGKALAVSPYSGACVQCVREADMQTAGHQVSGVVSKVWFYPYYVDKNNNVALIMDQEHNKWTFTQTHNATTVSASFSQSINKNVNYRVRVSYDGVNFQVSINGKLLLTKAAAAVPSGTVAFGAKGTTATFNDVFVFE